LFRGKSSFSTATPVYINYPHLACCKSRFSADADYFPFARGSGIIAKVESQVLVLASQVVAASGL
jgi:hypothetical protein